MDCWTLYLFWHLTALHVNITTSSSICSGPSQGMINPSPIVYAGLFAALVISSRCVWL